MPKIDVPVNSFQAGEIGPLLYGRTDTEFYGKSCRQLENMFVHAEGGVQKRGGTRFIAAAYDESNAVRFLPFNFTADQSYVMEFGNEYVRILTRDGVLLDRRIQLSNAMFDDDLTDWTEEGGTSASVTDGVVTLSAGGIFQEATSSFPLITNQEYEVNVSDASGTPTIVIEAYDDGASQWDQLFTHNGSDFTFTVTDSDYTRVRVYIRSTPEITFSAVMLRYVNRDFVVTSPYTSDQLQALQTVQSADVVFIVHPDVRPKEFARGLDDYGHITWTFSDYVFEDGPYGTVNTDEDKKLRAFVTTGSGNVVASGPDNAPFTESMVGGSVRIGNGYGTITSVTSATTVVVTVGQEFADTLASDNFYLPAWSNENGWPSVITLYEQRLVMGRTRLEPQGFWMTQSGSFYAYTPFDETGQVTDDSGLNNVILSGSRVSLMSFAVGTQNLVFGTGGGLYRTNTTNSAPFAASTARVLYDNGTECADIQPIQIGTLVLFTQRQRRKIFSAQYDFAADALVDDNIAQFARHLFVSPIKEMSLQREPHNLLWTVLDDGSLRSCTYLPSQGVVAWNRVVLGGSFRGGSPVVESVASISGYNEDNVWMVVRRTINGQERRYVERIVEELNTPLEESFYSDSALTFEDSKDISNVVINAGVATVTTSTDHGFSTGDRVNFYNIVVDATSDGETGTSINGLISTITVTDSTNFTVPVDSETTYNDYIENGIVRRYVTTITGLEHLEGQTVQVLADGAVRTSRQVSGGTVTLNRSAAIIVLGLTYRAILSPIRYDVQGMGGGVIKYKKIKNIETLVQLLDSVGMKYGVSLDRLDILPFRSTSDRMDTEVPLFSGKKEVKPSSDYTFEEPLYIVNDQPTPFAVTSLVYRLEVR